MRRPADVLLIARAMLLAVATVLACAGAAPAQTGVVVRTVSAGEDLRGFVREDLVNPAVLAATGPGAWPFVSGAWSAPRVTLDPVADAPRARMAATTRSTLAPSLAGVRFGLAPQGRIAGAGLAFGLQHGGATFDAETATRETPNVSGSTVLVQHTRAASSIDAGWMAVGIRVGARVSLGVSVGAERYRNRLVADTDLRESDVTGTPLGSVQRTHRSRDVLFESTLAPKFDYAADVDLLPGLAIGASYRAPVTADWKQARFDTTRVVEVYFPPERLFRVSTANGADSFNAVPMHLQPSVRYSLRASRATWPVQARVTAIHVRTVRLTMFAARPLLNAPMQVVESPASWTTLWDVEADRRVWRTVHLGAGWRQTLRTTWSVDGAAATSETIAGPRAAVAIEHSGWRCRAGAEWLAAPSASREPVRVAPAAAPRRVGETSWLFAVEKF